MHDDIYDHDHPDNFDIGEDEIVTDIEGLEMFSLKSVGIDIGSSTSHLIFSHITLAPRRRVAIGKIQSHRPGGALSLPDHADALCFSDQDRHR